MKKANILLLVLCFSFMVFTLKVSASHKTGHDGFLDISFDGDGKLINQLTEDEIESLQKSVSRKFFGWQTNHLNYNREVTYDGKILFSKSNKTSVPFYFEYKLTEEEVRTRSVNVSGSVSAKITGTIEKIKTTITGNAGSDIDYETETVGTEKMTTMIQMSIMPGKKITMITTGDAYLSSGYSIYYFFGIKMKKGLWETIEVETVYYELREEVIE